MVKKQSNFNVFSLYKQLKVKFWKEMGGSGKKQKYHSQGWNNETSSEVRKVDKVPAVEELRKQIHENPLTQIFVSQPLLSMISTRQIYVIKADNPKIGRICVIEIEMMEVSAI